MAELITLEYFHGEIHIGNLDTPAVAEKLQSFIDKYTKRYLNRVLGLKFSSDFEAAVKGHPETPMNENLLKIYFGSEYRHGFKRFYWNGFYNEDKTSPLANYIYYHYVVDQSTGYNAGTGTTVSKTENGQTIVPAHKLVRAWNEMVIQTEDLVGLFHCNPTLYPDWGKCREPFETINRFNL